MPSRTYWMPAVVLWFASMGWLLTSKVLPTLTNGQPPDYGDILPKTEVVNPDPVRWSIRWNSKKIGWAENKITRSTDGTGRILSKVQFEELPVDQMLQDLLGVLGRFAGTMTGEIGNIDLMVLTSLDFDHYGVLNRLDTTVNVGDLNDLLHVQGQVIGEKLDLRARVRTGNGLTDIYREKEIHLPPDALLTDSFSPRPKLANLRVGQTWTFQSYQPLMPHSPLTLIQAHVEREELLEWNGQMVRTRKVAFSRDSGSGISSTRMPVAELWVQKDGTVLRQDLKLASVKVQFVRVRPEATKDDSIAKSQSEAVGTESRSKQ